MSMSHIYTLIINNGSEAEVVEMLKQVQGSIPAGDYLLQNGKMHVEQSSQKSSFYVYEQKQIVRAFF